MSEWQTIDSAPNDGTVVLFHRNGEVYAGWYDSLDETYPWHFVDDVKNPVSGCCDREVDGMIEYNGWGYKLGPTHWMPLPKFK